MCLNTSRPDKSYRQRWPESALVEVMVYCLVTAKPLPTATMILLSIGTSGNQIQWNYNKNTKHSIQNAVNVSSAIWRPSWPPYCRQHFQILFRTQCVNPLSPDCIQGPELLRVCGGATQGPSFLTLQPYISILLIVGAAEGSVHVRLRAVPGE